MVRAEAREVEREILRQIEQQEMEAEIASRFRRQYELDFGGEWIYCGENRSVLE